MSRRNDDIARAAIQNGATTAHEIADQTDLTDRQAREALNHLEATGEVKADGNVGNARTQQKFKPTGQ